MPWGKVSTVWGIFYAAWEERGLVALCFPGKPPAETLFSHPLLQELRQELDQYFQGERAAFTVPVKLTGPPFFRQVWAELRTVPYGETVTYGELARRTGGPQAARAVGQAMAKNPLPILVPCHRVVGKGDIGGFGPGLAWKERLLALERRYKAKFSPR